MAIYKFRSRYGEQDTSHLLPENQPQSRNSLWWACILCSCRAACSSRIRIFTSVVMLLALAAVVQNASSILRFVDNQSPTQAHRQSFGYVDVPKWKWQSQKDHYKRVHATPRTQALPPSPTEIPGWYQSHLEVDFVCPDRHLLGDGWWICNYRHISKNKNCIIYSSGPPMALLTEQALSLLLPSCEVHVFDPSNTTWTPENSTIMVHPWGFGDETKSIMNAKNSTFDVKTIEDTMKDLSHRHVDLLLLQCAGCEWYLSYANVHQILVVANGMRNADWFDKWRKNEYVLFHKQPVEVGGLLGQGQALSYLKLRSGFFPPYR
jgi:hypothetical protein